jgi:hypothetical protein
MQEVLVAVPEGAAIVGNGWRRHRRIAEAGVMAKPRRASGSDVAPSGLEAIMKTHLRNLGGGHRRWWWRVIRDRLGLGAAKKR